MRKRAAAVALLAALSGGACERQTAVSASSRRVVRLVSDTTTSQPLAAEYARSMPNIDVRVVPAEPLLGTVTAIQRGDADLGFVLADVAYLANAGVAGPAASRGIQLRGMAALQTAPIHLLARRGVSLADILGPEHLRVGLNGAFSSQTMLAGLVLGAYGFEDQHARNAPLTLDEIPRALSNGTIDVAFVTAYYPSRTVAAATTGGSELLPIDSALADRLRRRYPFVRRVSIPPQTYPGQRVAIRTIGVDRLLVCRSDLDEGLVHDLTRQFIEAVPRIFASLRASSRLIDLDRASATPIPLHNGAALYYRERELSP
jgi:TRAP transporter TAXI family solute receptor